MLVRFANPNNAFFLILLLTAAIALSGCGDKADLNPNNKSAVCKALVGPIKYNSQNTASHRFAADQLAPDLATRNKIGKQLGCPQYR